MRAALPQASAGACYAGRPHRGGRAKRCSAAAQPPGGAGSSSGEQRQQGESPLYLPRARGLFRPADVRPGTVGFGKDGDFGFGLPPGLQRLGPDDLPTQGRSVVEGSRGVALAERDSGGAADLDYLSELMAIQQGGPRDIGFFGTRNMGLSHQKLIEILSYAMVLTDNHIFTSGATGTNAAVISGALRAERPELLTVVLPQSLSKQPPESQDLLQKVQNLVEMPQNDDMTLLESSRICNADILRRVQQVICFAFHDSKVLLETCAEAKQLRKIVTLFYLD